MKPPHKKYIPFIIILICIVSRLPQLLNHGQILDGDECVEALMAKHLYTLKELPLFFYGQRYGFSLPECLAILPFYAVGGFTTLAVKAGMLLLWTAGVLFLYRAFENVCTKNALLPLLAITIFILNPAWAVWSMKARGGYLSAFLFSSMLLYVLTSATQRTKGYWALVCGLLTVLVYQSQPIFLPGLTPIVGFYLFSGRNLKTIAVFTATSIIAGAVFWYYKQSLPDGYTPPFFSFDSTAIRFITRIPQYLYSSLHGYYFASQIQQPPAPVALFAKTIFTTIMALIASSAYLLVTRKQGYKLLHLTIVSLLLTLGCTVFTNQIHPRYLLPITGYTLFSLAVLLHRASFNLKYIAPIFGLLSITGIMSLIAFKDFKFTTMKKDKFGLMLGYLKCKNITHIYCYDYMLTYQAIFYSNEKIIARERAYPGRYEAFTAETDNALKNGLKTALVLNEFQLDGLNLISTTKFYGYIIAEDPSLIELNKIFRFSNLDVINLNQELK